MTIEEAHKKLDSEYERSVEIPFVRNNVAHALFRVWRVADMDHTEKNKKVGGEK